MKEINNQKKIKIGEDKYTLQLPSALWYLDTVDSCRDENGNLLSSKYMGVMLENVVVSPRMKIDDFTGNIRTLRTLLKECESFILGEELSAVEDDEKSLKKPAGKE